MIKLTFAGAARDVTGSRHLLDINDHRVLFDCGLYQGRRKDTYEKNLNFPFDPASINSLILSHAHIDHIGNVPNLVKKGFRGEIHCTLATADLASIMLMDSARIQEGDIVFVNKIRHKHGEPPVDPLYTPADIPPVINSLQTHGYDRLFKLNSGLQAVLHNAGHVLGSAITTLYLEDAGRKLAICYTGDLGRKNMPILEDPFIVRDADILIIESTYGDRLHADIHEAGAKLARIINETISRQGKLIVPSFALERTQELIYLLHELRIKNAIPDFPIFVDSPLAIDATDIFRLHPECFDAETLQMMDTEEDPFGFRHLHYTRSVDESKKLNTISGPLMIIAGSGMAEAGRILHHLKNNIGDPRNTVLIVGHQSENTLGRKIADKLEHVPIFGELYNLRSRVEIFDEFSAHADRHDLLEWIGQAKDRWRRIFVVHGEEESSLSLAEALREAGFPDVVVPELGQEFAI